MTRSLLEQCLTKWLEDADPDECIDLVEAIRVHLAKPQSEPVACLVKTDSGTMVWPIEDFNDAGTYCEPDEFPQYLYLHPAHTEACKWTLDDELSETYASACGELWGFIDGGPIENRVKFCHGCGRPVKLGVPP